MKFQFCSVKRLILPLLLSFLVTISGASVARAQLPFFPTTDEPSQEQQPLFNYLNRPESCGNLLCSQVWMQGSMEPLLKIAAPGTNTPTVEDNVISIDVRARSIQQKLDVILNETLRRLEVSPQNSDTSDATSSTTEQPKTKQSELILNKVPKSRPTINPNSLTSLPDSKSQLHPRTPEIEVAIERNAPVVLVPTQEGLLKQTLLTVTEWDIISNQTLISPLDPQQSQKINQWREEILSAADLSEEKVEAILLAKIWQGKIQTRLSDALIEQEKFREKPLQPFKESLIIFLITLTFGLGIFLVQRFVRSKRRRLRHKLKTLENSLAEGSENLSPEEFAAKIAEQEIVKPPLNPIKPDEKREKKSDNQNQKDATSLENQLLSFVPKSLLDSYSYNLESLWEYVPRFCLRQRTIWKQQLNLLLLIREILIWFQFFLWGFGIAMIMSLYPALRPYTSLIVSSPVLIAGIWLFFSLLDKVFDFSADYMLSRWATEAQLVSPNPQRYNLRVKTYSAALSQTTTVIAYGLAFVCSLSVLGLSTEGLASAGILTIVASYIFQPQIKNLIRGCLILLNDEFAIGDIVKIGEVSGFVEQMNLYMTYLRGAEGRLITIPNGNIEIVENLTKDWSRVEFKIEIAYGSDVQKAIEVIQRVAEEMRHEEEWHDLILEPATILGVDQVSHTGVLIQVWIKTQPMQQWAVGREFRLRIKLAFDQAGIAIGMPQQSLWYHPDKPKDETAINSGQSPLAS
ncbi:MAG: mechanosensitive ion channel family protein [Microcoleaceae cyanobacterium]